MVLALLFTQSAQAQKIAVIDVNAVGSQMPEYQAATAKIQSLQKMYQDSMQAMKTKYLATKDTYDKLGSAANSDTKKKEDDDLAAQEAAYAKFNTDKFGQDGEIAQTSANLMKPIQDKLQNTLEAFAKKEHIAVILPKTATVYADPTLDQTTKFEEYLKTAQ
jgi:outer membrane protein